MGIYLHIFTVIFFSLAINLHAEHEKHKLQGKNRLNKFLRPFYPKRLRNAYRHSLLRNNRARSDVNPSYPLVDVWQYQYKPSGQDVITSKNPIATKQEHWRHPNEARIISITLYGDNRIYLDGLLDHIDSIDHVNDINGFKENRGLKSFTFRIYVAKRNPSRLKEMGELINATNDDFITELLERGCEIAFVDNGREVVTKDATFWRFMVVGEKMPKGQRIRYLVRDADWWVTGAELFSVLEWIDSGFDFHRMHLFSLCIGPLTASIWGGTHKGAGHLNDIKRRIQYYPYRTLYGDDELFTRDVIWPQIKGMGSVLTHIGKRGYLAKLSNPYKNSCEEPTQVFCDKVKPGGICEDRKLPESITFPQTKVGMRFPLRKVIKRSEYFFIAGRSPRINRAIKVH